MSPQGQLEVAEEPDRVCKALQNRIFSKDSREAESNQDIDIHTSSSAMPNTEDISNHELLNQRRYLRRNTAFSKDKYARQLLKLKLTDLSDESPQNNLSENPDPSQLNNNITESVANIVGYTANVTESSKRGRNGDGTGDIELNEIENNNVEVKNKAFSALEIEGIMVSKEERYRYLFHAKSSYFEIYCCRRAVTDFTPAEPMKKGK